MITVYETKDYKWDEIVKQFKRFDVYYMAGYVKAFEINGDGKANLIYYENKNLRALNIVIKRNIDQLKDFYDYITPYGYGGWLMEGDCSDFNIMKLKQDYEDFCIKNNIVSEFVRFSPFLENSKDSKLIYDVVDLGNTISINTDSKEQIWNNLISKNRNMIRKAQKNDVKIYKCKINEKLDNFISMYNKTMDNDSASSYYYFKKDFYESIAYDLPFNHYLFYAEYENKIISMAIILFANENVHYHLSTTDREYNYLAPMNLLLYEVSNWACENKYKKVHLGGGVGSQEDNLYKFKAAFNKNSNCVFSIGKKIFNQEIYNELVNKKNDKNNSNFFPIYRI